MPVTASHKRMDLSHDELASNLPLGLKATFRNVSELAAIVRNSWPLSASQIFSMLGFLPSFEPLTISLPSGLIARQKVDPVCPSKVSSFSPLDGLRRENLSVLSKKAVLQTVAPGQPLFCERATDKKTYYLVRGDVELRKGTTPVGRLSGNTPEAKHPITPGVPRRFGAYAITAVETLVFDSELLDVLLTWDQTGIYDVKELTPDSTINFGDWMAVLLQIKAFHRIPPSSLQAIFMRLERVNYRAGEVVVRQGDAGDHFYAITAGRCSVTRAHPLNPAGIKLAELEPGDSFGDEALICGEKRDATVTMLTDGALVRLKKDDFNSLLHEPMLQRQSSAEATERVANGQAQWLDVRLPSEFKASHLPGAINVPLCILRLNLTRLDPNADYIVVCDTERRGSAGAFILNARGFKAVVLQGGLPPAGLAAGE